MDEDGDRWTLSINMRSPKRFSTALMSLVIMWGIFIPLFISVGKTVFYAIFPGLGGMIGGTITLVCIYGIITSLRMRYLVIEKKTDKFSLINDYKGWKRITEATIPEVAGVLIDSLPNAPPPQLVKKLHMLTFSYGYDLAIILTTGKVLPVVQLNLIQRSDLADYFGMIQKNLMDRLILGKNKPVRTPGMEYTVLEYSNDLFVGQYKPNQTATGQVGIIFLIIILAVFGMVDAMMGGMSLMVPSSVGTMQFVRTIVFLALGIILGIVFLATAAATVSKTGIARQHLTVDARRGVIEFGKVGKDIEHITGLKTIQLDRIKEVSLQPKHHIVTGEYSAIITFTYGIFLDLEDGNKIPILTGTRFIGALRYYVMLAKFIDHVKGISKPGASFTPDITYEMVIAEENQRQKELVEKEDKNPDEDMDKKK